MVLKWAPDTMVIFISTKLSFFCYSVQIEFVSLIYMLILMTQFCASLTPLHSGILQVWSTCQLVASHHLLKASYPVLSPSHTLSHLLSHTLLMPPPLDKILSSHQRATESSIQTTNCSHTHSHVCPVLSCDWRIMARSYLVTCCYQTGLQSVRWTGWGPNNDGFTTLALPVHTPKRKRMAAIESMRWSGCLSDALIGAKTGVQRKTVQIAYLSSHYIYSMVKFSLPEVKRKKKKQQPLTVDSKEKRNLNQILLLDCSVSKVRQACFMSFSFSVSFS